MGAAGDGRAPTEELSSMRSSNFCSLGMFSIYSALKDAVINCRPGPVVTALSGAEFATHALHSHVQPFLTLRNADCYLRRSFCA